MRYQVPYPSSRIRSSTQHKILDHTIRDAIANLSSDSEDEDIDNEELYRISDSIMLPKITQSGINRYLEPTKSTYDELKTMMDPHQYIEPFFPNFRVYQQLVMSTMCQYILTYGWKAYTFIRLVLGHLVRCILIVCNSWQLTVSYGLKLILVYDQFVTSFLEDKNMDFIKKSRPSTPSYVESLSDIKSSQNERTTNFSNYNNPSNPTRSATEDVTGGWTEDRHYTGDLLPYSESGSDS